MSDTYEFVAEARAVLLLTGLPWHKVLPKMDEPQGKRIFLLARAMPPIPGMITRLGPDRYELVIDKGDCHRPPSEVLQDWDKLELRAAVWRVKEDA